MGIILFLTSDKSEVVLFLRGNLFSVFNVGPIKATMCDDIKAMPLWHLISVGTFCELRDTIFCTYFKNYFELSFAYVEYNPIPPMLFVHHIKR